MSSLYFSALDIGLTRRDALRFLRDYFGRPLREILKEMGLKLLAYLVREAIRPQGWYLRKYAKGAEQ